METEEIAYEALNDAIFRIQNGQSCKWYVDHLQNEDKLLHGLCNHYSSDDIYCREKSCPLNRLRERKTA